MKTIITLALLLLSHIAFTQDVSNEEQIIGQIKHLFDGMRNVDTTGFAQMIVPDATLQSISIDKQDSTQIKRNTMQDFVRAVAKPRDQVWDEHIHSYEIKIDGALALAWTEYTFYLDGKLLHCGVNVFHLAKVNRVWKILSITDTRRKTRCIE